MIEKIRKSLGKNIYRLFFGLEPKHINNKFNNWRYKLLTKNLRADSNFKKLLDNIPQKYIEDHWVKDSMGPKYKKLITRIRAAQTLYLLEEDLKTDQYYKIIDIGASDGLFLYRFKGELIGTNVEEVCVNRINEEGFKGVCAEIYKAPFEDNYFDAAFCFEVIEHLDDPIQAMRELVRISKKYIYVSTPFVKRTKLNPYFSEKDKASTNQHVFMFDHDDIINLATYVNSTIDYIKTIDPLDMCKVGLMDKIFIYLINFKIPKWTIFRLSKND